MGGETKGISGAGLLIAGAGVGAVGVVGTPSIEIAKVALALNAIVTPVERRPEGSLIEVVLPAWSVITRLAKESPEALSQLSPEQWEQLVAASYDREGYEVVLTPRSGDFGRDVIATKQGQWSVRIIDQVKAYSPGHVVPANDVRALLGVLGSDRNVSKAVMTTTSAFAPRLSEDPFIMPYIPYRLELIDGPALLKRLRTASGGV